MTISSSITYDSAAITPAEELLWKKVMWRILPLLMLCYIVAYLDRINVGVAKLQMSADLSFSDAVYGLGAGIFFLGYFFFEIPTNLALHRFGARRLIGSILISWAVIAPCTAFVTTPMQFYLVRFLLGVAEAGFYPGVILYLSFWFPSWRRGRMFALFATAVPVSGVIGSPLSGWIMEYFNGSYGMEGWKWLYIIEGLPSLLIGAIVIYFLTDRIEQASWLTRDEKDLMTKRLAEDSAQHEAHDVSIWAVFRNKKVWLLTFIYFCLIAGFYTVGFWLPTLVHNAGVTDIFTVGLLTAIPYAAAIVTMLVASRSADKHRERRWHLAFIAILSGVGMVISAMYSHNLIISMIGLTLGAAGGLSTLPMFWSLPTAFLGGSMAAVGIALINSFGNLAGFVAPYLMGLLNDLTHSTQSGVLIISATLFVGAAAVFLIPARMVNR
ncbi:MFS transporter [[Pantoea] beijingensis]|uniref:MFS transporter n=1 Tax=[Pantoea] beijingensis TaxID=1324864 RepID=A0A443IBI8_9GAMM|nr:MULTISPECIES: MFS transporter [Erwiniaceae]RWR01454.1 MFS transporter [[Pantoea] beijingensis]